ncbi:MAG: ARMT1-like domain-containing protein [Desulfobacterales bacterium]
MPTTPPLPPPTAEGEPCKPSPECGPGQDPAHEAWLTTFFLENHIDHYAYPEHVASPEKVRFMVYTDGNERYYPCSDAMFAHIMDRACTPFIQEAYQQVYQRVMTLIEDQISDESEKAFLKALIQIKYQHETRDQLMIPSRLEKRLVSIFLNRTQIEDPYLFEKAERNRQARRVLESKFLRQALNHIGQNDQIKSLSSLRCVRERLEHLELSRLLNLAVAKELWETTQSDLFNESDYLKLLMRPLTGNGMHLLFDFLGIVRNGSEPQPLRSKKILWLADEAGEILVDLTIIHFLARLGHKVIIAFKEGPLYTKVHAYDAQGDQVLQEKLAGAYWIRDGNLTKNALLDIFRSENHILALSDGTRENLNLLLTSTTFARTFKEVDGIISRGEDQKRRLFESHFQFTQDIFNITRGCDGNVVISYKDRHPAVVKFAHEDLEEKAQAIITQMRQAKETGMTVMFYSGIIGSIPGKIQMAKQIMGTTVDHLRRQSAHTFIINPSEHFEHGMDADDLMYMWEIVQSCGYIDIWRFQTYADIVFAFEIMNRPVPPEWVGKDATYSTGCTKEMRIAKKVQEKHPEMQIIGPAPEKFVRGDEYGLGKMYDQRLSEVLHQKYYPD